MNQNQVSKRPFKVSNKNNERKTQQRAGRDSDSRDLGREKDKELEEFQEDTDKDGVEDHANEDDNEDQRNSFEKILIRRLMQTCEEAYENGANSVDIYKVLHSQELLKSATEPVISTPIFSSSQSNPINNNNDRDRKWTIVRFLLRLNSLLFNCSWCIIMFLVSCLVLCHVLDLNPFYYFPSVMEKRCLLQAHPVLLEMSRPIANCSICSEFQSTGSPVIEYKRIPLKEEFHSVVYSSRPIIIRGGAFKNGMAVAFDFAKLKDLFQSEEDGVESVSKECQFLPFRSPFDTLREAFETISDTATWDQPWYIGWSNCHPGVAAKLRKLFPRPHFLPEDSESSAIDWIFIGTPGLGASMHIDYVRRPSWQAQLSGEKKWILKPPPECESYCPHTISFTIHPGDMLFVETNLWYHETLIQGTNLSISIGSEYD